MSDLTALQTRAEQRLAVNRLGTLTARETDLDLVVIRDLLDETRRLQAAVANWELWADNLTPRCCCGNCYP
ncbi:hypothetical protein [Tessaracoccus palaemonis]|uniref:Uncharacterized protein n=1 Tax=Tessaracoccus palaemonis TaxID=2829499 RepID=A0ABX8SHG8_9ACTN|nr:hypothetical protein [Tessaracoccus palaemonis]QXT62735.1 hypothetical protein KDB89_13530 [Tessaracoccus palaemonis]